MSKVFSVNVLICATAYIVADTAEEAAAMAQESFGDQAEASVSTRTVFGDVEVSGAQFEHLEEGPAVTLSPALTFQGLATDLATASAPFTADNFEEVHDSEDLDEDTPTDD